MKLRARDFIQIIDKEIEWCKANPVGSLSESGRLTPEWRVGFINGLEQAKLLIARLEQAINEPQPTRQPGWSGNYGGSGSDPVDV